MLRIDGSKGEGGGQVLRTALALSVSTQTPFVIENIRAGRKKPGLLRQHLTAVEAARAISGARVEGSTLGSRGITFAPGPLRPGAHEVQIGSGGSAMLVLQAVLPALLATPEPTSVSVHGGTHNPMAPPFEFFDRAFLRCIRRQGADVHATLGRVGFMLAGGGMVQMHVQSGASPRGFELLERGALRRRDARVLISHVPPSVGTRELRPIVDAFDLARDEARVDEVGALGPGNVILYTLEYEHVTEVFAAFGERSVRAETIANRLIRDVRHYLRTDAPVGRHLADQLLIPLALAGEGAFRTGPLSRHTTTNMDVIRAFLDVDFVVEDDAGATRITVNGEKR